MDFDDRTFILQEQWPYWPFLPIKRHTDMGLECATLIAPSCSRLIHELMYTVLLVGFPDIDDGDTIAELPQHHYVSIDAVLADGWKVD